MSTAVVCCDFIKKLKVPWTPYEKAVKATISARYVRIFDGLQMLSCEMQHMVAWLITLPILKCLPLRV
jgi:hypothetical protein